MAIVARRGGAAVGIADEKALAGEADDSEMGNYAESLARRESFELPTLRFEGGSNPRNDAILH